MPTALVILPSTTYRAAGFVDAAAGLGVDLIVASENPPPLDMGEKYIQIDCSEPERAAESIVAKGESVGIDAVVAADDGGVIVSAIASQRLGLLGNDPSGAGATRDKAAQRRLMAAAEVPQPRFVVIDAGGDGPTGLSFPVVVKPTDRSASQGVMRVDEPGEMPGVLTRLRQIVGEQAPFVVEEFIDGDEVALEGLLKDGLLTTLAIFDKPEASQGPAFPETILVTPSLLSADAQQEVERVAAAALGAVGLEHGPVHVEMKVQDTRVSVIEVAARSIGGLCSQTLNFGLSGTTLETLILRNALGLDKPELHRESVASGVLMIPIPVEGIFGGISNEAEIRGIPHVTGIDLTVRPGTPIAPPPIGDRYLGFVFARASRAPEVTGALTRARDIIEVQVT